MCGADQPRLFSYRDFNKGNLTHNLPKYRQVIKCPTRGENILDHCYTTVRDAYHAVPRAALGHTDHVMVHLILAYRQKLKLCKPVVRTSRKWTSEAVEVLQACLDSTDWDVFRTATNSLDEYTEAVTSYISFCEDCCVPSCTRVSYNNDKPWFTAKLRRLRMDKEEAFRSGDKDRFKEAKYKLSKAVKEAKRLYSEKLQHQFSANDSASVWKGLRQITNYKPKAPHSINDQRLANDLNEFYCRFERQRDSPATIPHESSQQLQLQCITSTSPSSAGAWAPPPMPTLKVPPTPPPTSVTTFNTIIPALLQEKLSQLSVPDSTCKWITDFLSDRKQHVKLGKHVSDSQSISTGSPKGCVLSPLLFSLYTNSYTSSHQSVKLLKFADDTTLIGLISDGDESAYRWEADHLVTWCHRNNLVLNAL